MEELILNRYRPIEQAGVGGFGKVIVAYDTRVHRRVAIKCIELNTQTIGSIVDAAGEHWEEDVPGLAEARTAAMIQDSNIVTVYDFELKDNMAYIIMEYVEGLTLTQFLYHYGKDMTLDMATSIISDVAHAISAGHNENVLHLDIKPDNIIIDYKGKVKVTDFGLATLADEFGYGRADAGTIGYMPPEQMRQQDLDARCDQWSLACVVYEILSGHNPFLSKDIPSALNKIYDANLPLVTNSWEGLDPSVNDAVFRALQPDAEKRFESVQEFMENLLPNLGSIKAGKRQLSALFKEEEEQEEVEVETPSIMSNPKFYKIVSRIFAVLCSSSISILGCLNLASINPFNYILFFVAAATTAIFPSVGICVSVATLAIALYMTSNYIIASVLVLVSAAWLFFCIRREVVNANTAGCFSLFGSFGFAQISPFVSGMFCKPKYALINTIYGFFLCLTLGSLGSSNLIGWNIFSNWKITTNIQGNFLHMLTQADVIVLGISWILCSVIISLMFLTNKKAIKILGIVIGFIILIVGICIGNYFAHNMMFWQPQGWQILPTVLAGVCAVVAAVFLPSKASKLTPREE